MALLRIKEISDYRKDDKNNNRNTDNYFQVLDERSGYGFFYGLTDDFFKLFRGHVHNSQPKKKVSAAKSTNSLNASVTGENAPIINESLKVIKSMISPFMKI
ncbi:MULTISPECIES: hypothetical protein [unclassified Morganella (in: enterobacteria)]|uniref:hypothetical protein n=1 Tax=unclassified Morganella (in: enterobacteria) TaxID=2676694 RepID=UPI0029420761|nr:MULTISPECIES: hypothetical protein [unclassified Morganella (in: enterobacteria)]